MLFLLLPLLLYYRCCCFSCGYCCRLIFSLVLQVVPVLHASDLVPLVSFLQLLAAATFSPETRLFQTIRAQLQTTANHMTESLQMAMLSGAYCPAMDCRACAVLRFEAFDWRFDHRLEDVLPCFRGALDAYEPGPRHAGAIWLIRAVTTTISHYVATASRSICSWLPFLMDFSARKFPWLR